MAKNVGGWAMMPIEYLPGSLFTKEPEFLLPGPEILVIFQLWLEQAPKLNDEERRIAARLVCYLMTPPMILPKDGVQ